MKDGDPNAVRHLRPDHMPSHGGVEVQEDDSEAEDILMDHTYTMLKRLREPFLPEQIEHLPKQKFKKAWEDQPYQNCDECGGYHPLGSRTIHLDYVGHAGVTQRLLEVDPLWDWEPLDYNADGLPVFDKHGGLWIKLTVCGVTRLGYGDAAGKPASTTAVKEIIGDAIRNAAMRFGVALDLWSKSDLHFDRNPGATDSEARQQHAQERKTSRRRDDEGSEVHGRRDGNSAGDGPSGTVRDGGAVASDAPRSKNQDALDALADVCNKHGYSTEYAIERWDKDHDVHITLGTPADISALAVKLIEESTAEPGVDAPVAGADEPAGVQQNADDTGTDAPADNGVGPDEGATTSANVGAASPEDTSDVEKQPGDIF